MDSEQTRTEPEQEQEQEAVSTRNEDKKAVEAAEVVAAKKEASSHKAKEALPPPPLSAAVDRQSLGDRPALSVQQIDFDNKHHAKLVAVPLDTPAAEVVTALGLAPPDVLLLMFGDAEELDEKLHSHLVQLLSRGLARTVAPLKTIIIDQGRLSSTTTLMGKAVADRGRKSLLLGVAAADSVTYPGGPADKTGQKQALEPNHTHFVLSDDDETETLFALAKSLVKPKSVVSILIGGGEVAEKQILESVRQGWPVIILKESGGLANTLTTLNQEQPSFIADPEMAEIMVEGKLYFVQLSGPVSVFERLLEQLITQLDDDDTPSTLHLVWQRFAIYDKNAVRQQTDFSQRQVLILGLGVLATFLALLETTLKVNIDVGSTIMAVIDQILFLILLLIPIVIAVLTAVANRFSAGSKWILLRATAESVKKEIYRYRSRVEIYSDRETRTISREMKLYRKMESLARKLMQSEVNVSALQPYTGPIPPKYGAAEGDDGLSFLTPDRYLTLRLEDQLAWYTNKTVRIERQMKRLQWLIYLFGGLGTLLVAVGLELWIALSTAVVAALTTFLEYRQLEGTLMRYNQTATDLANIRSWWIALAAEEQADPRNIDKLVGQTETTIHSEHASWVQDMQEALAELRAELTEESQEQAEAT